MGAFWFVFHRNFLGYEVVYAKGCNYKLHLTSLRIRFVRSIRFYYTLWLTVNDIKINERINDNHQCMRCIKKPFG